VIVTVPEAEPVVGEWRMQYTYDAPAGIPSHVTVLFPFVPSKQAGEAARRVGEIVAATPAFELRFARTARFPELLYLDPEPAEPFITLTEAIAAEWPEHPPYEGAHETVIPHLTVAESEDSALLDRIAAQVEPQLPIELRVEEASLFVEDDRSRWHEHSRLPLAGHPRGSPTGLYPQRLCCKHGLFD
jgi:2'-5' RNA ligase